MALFDEVSQIVAGQSAATQISGTFGGSFISGNTLVLLSVDRSGQQNPTPIGTEGVTGDPTTGWQVVLDLNTLPLDSSFRRHLVMWIVHVDALDDPTATVRGCTYDANTNGVIICVQFEGVLDLDQIASANSDVNAVSSQTTGTTPTTTTAAELILGAVLVRHGSAGTVGWTNSLVTVAEHANGSGSSRIRASLADLVVAATGAYESTASWTTATTSTAGMVTLKQAGGAGGQTIAVNTASETEAAQTVAVVVGAVSVAVTAATESEAAQAIAVDTTVTVAVGAATESESAEIVTPVAGAILVSVGAAIETEAAEAVAVVQGGGAQIIAVDLAIETETAEVVAPVAGGSPQSITVTSATETEAAQAVTVVAGAVSITVTAATETETAGVVAPVQGGSPQSIAVTAAVETETVQAVTVAVLQTVGVAVESETAVAVGIIPGTTSIMVGAAIETETARIVAPVAGAEYDMVITHGGPTDNWRTGGLKGQWSTGTLSKRGHTHGPIKT